MRNPKGAEHISVPLIRGQPDLALRGARAFKQARLHRNVDKSADRMEIPTNVPVTRIDDDDEVYRTVEEKFHAITNVIKDCKSRGQPVLVGTTSIEKSEFLADMNSKTTQSGARRNCWAFRPAIA